MFKDHNPIINRWSQRNFSNFKDTVMFVVLSVKTPFHTLEKQMEDYRIRGLDSKYVWGFKKDTLVWLNANGYELYQKLMELKDAKFGIGRGLADNTERDRRMMALLVEVPGLGLAKAGFVMQMVFGRVGCIDIHNLRRLRTVSVKDVQFTKMATDKTKLKKINNYVSICKHNNSTQRLWDQWCEQLTQKQCNKGRFDSGHDVSRYHVTALMGI